MTQPYIPELDGPRPTTAEQRVKLLQDVIHEMDRLNKENAFLQAKIISENARVRELIMVRDNLPTPEEIGIKPDWVDDRMANVCKLASAALSHLQSDEPGVQRQISAAVDLLKPLAGGCHDIEPWYWFGLPGEVNVLDNEAYDNDLWNELGTHKPLPPDMKVTGPANEPKSHILKEAQRRLDLQALNDKLNEVLDLIEKHVRKK